MAERQPGLPGANNHSLDALRHHPHGWRASVDPSTGRPAYTGIVQATALAPTAADAEVRAKAALLTGGDHAPLWLAHGGVLVFDDGSHAVIDQA